MIKKVIKSTALLLFCILISNNLLKAQPGDPDPDAVPLDPGSWVLIAAGVGYGVKKWKDAKTHNKINTEDATEDVNQKL